MAWNIDTQHSQVEFSVRHMMISKVRGHFDTFEGSIKADPNDAASGIVEGTIDVASIDTKEQQRDDHLRSGDFFDVENFPKITFKSTNIEAAGDNAYKVTGDMTIKGVTKEVVFDVTDEGQGKDPWGNQRWGLSATTTIDRKDFGLTWNVALETGGFLVGEEISIFAEVQLIYQAEEVAA